ncbi:MAG: hypothetical protein V3T58_00580 [Candidatus Hydrothermarchaeales archaeon]
MYRGKAEAALGDIKLGERIKIEKGDRYFEGVLMPRTELGDEDHIVLKFDNGYNIGIEVSEIRISRASK